VAECHDSFEVGLNKIIRTLKRYDPVQSDQDSAQDLKSKPVIYLDELLLDVDLDLQAVDRFRHRLKANERVRFPVDMSPADFVADLGLMRRRALTRDGVLLFGRRPEAHIPQAICRCSLFRFMSNTSARVPNDIYGTIPDQIEKIRDFIAANVGGEILEPEKLLRRFNTNFL
jgi:predicted HTH transcriptional regulator